MHAKLLAEFLLECGDFFFVQLLQLGRVDVYNRRAATDHDAVELVEIFLADRIKLMVVTARTRHGDAEDWPWKPHRSGYQ